jgi:hypothetical protein
MATETEGLPLFADERLATVERVRLSYQAQLILQAFRQQGSLTNLQLTNIAQRFGGRIFDLRKAGHDIRLESQDHETGVSVYRYHGRMTPPASKQDGVARRLARTERALKIAWEALERAGDKATLEQIKTTMQDRA